MNRRVTIVACVACLFFLVANLVSTCGWILELNKRSQAEDRRAEEYQEREESFAFQRNEAERAYKNLAATGENLLELSKHLEARAKFNRETEGMLQRWADDVQKQKEEIEKKRQQPAPIMPKITDRQ